MSEPTALPNAIPARSGKPPEIPAHTLLRCIGKGSFGEVWLGRTVLGAYRAVKIVSRDTFESDRPYEREFTGIKKFEPYSRNHQGLVDILQVGRNDAKGYFYYVMELADDASGSLQFDPTTYQPRTLHSTDSTRRRISFEECVRVGISLASAAGHLHRNGLVHRDIKPSNIIFVDDAPKLADVGLVTGVDANTIPAGTMGFLAPEGVPNAQADIYSLGKVLYELSTGNDRQDFPALPTEWIEAEEIPKLMELNEVILRACEKDPADRYQSMEELEADLVLLQSGKSVKRLRVLERRVALLTRAALAVLLLALVAAVAYYQVYRSRREATERLATAYIKAGADSIEQGDTFEALLRFTEALRLHQGDSRREASDRVRLAMTLNRCPRLLHMWFQDRVVNAVDFSPDGQWVVMAGGGGQVVIWDIEKNEQITALVGHGTDKDVESVAFDKTGEYIVTASGDHTVRVWERATGHEIRRLEHPRTVYAAQFSPDGQRILTAGADAVGRIWDWRAREVKFQLTGHTGAILHAAFSPDGQRVVTTSMDATARLWDPETGEPTAPPLPHGKPIKDAWVYHAAFSPDGRRLVTGCSDYKLRFWDVATGEFKEDLDQGGPIRSVEFSPDGRYVLIGCWDRSTTRLWDTFARKAAGPPLKNAYLVTCARFSPDGARIVTSDRKGIVCVWALTPINWRPRKLQADFSADGSRYAVAASGGVEVRDATNDHALCLLPAAATVTKTYLSADGSRLLVLSRNTNVLAQFATGAQLWNVATTQALSAFFASEAPGKSSLASLTQLSRDGTRFVTVANKLPQLWDTTGQPGQRLKVPPSLTNSLKKLFFSPEGRSLGAVAGKWVFVWDVSTGTNRLCLRHEALVEHAEFSPEGGRLVTACKDDDDTRLSAQVWDALSGRPLGPPLRHLDGVSWASFSPEGRRVATASEDRTAQVWNPATGERLTAQIHHGGEVWFAGFSLDGRWLLTTCRDNTARVWEAETGDPIIPPLLHLGSPSSAQFIAGRRRIVTRRAAGDCWIWDLPADNRSAADLVQMIQLLSQHRSERIDDVFPLDKDTLRQHWQTLVARFPKAFTISAAEILYWHEREAEEAERSGSLSAALFHLDCLLKSGPPNPSLKERRDNLFDTIQNGQTGKP